MNLIKFKNNSFHYSFHENKTSDIKDVFKKSMQKDMLYPYIRSMTYMHNQVTSTLIISEIS